MANQVSGIAYLYTAEIYGAQLLFKIDINILYQRIPQYSNTTNNTQTMHEQLCMP